MEGSLDASDLTKRWKKAWHAGVWQMCSERERPSHTSVCLAFVENGWISRLWFARDASPRLRACASGLDRRLRVHFPTRLPLLGSKGFPYNKPQSGFGGRSCGSGRSEKERALACTERKEGDKKRLMQIADRHGCDSRRTSGR